MAEVSLTTMSYLAWACENDIENVLDDPDESSPVSLQEWYEILQKVCSDCDKDFWEIANRVGTEYEVQRLKKLLEVK